MRGGGSEGGGAVVWELEAVVQTIKLPNAVPVGTEVVLHCVAVKQAARLLEVREGGGGGDGCGGGGEEEGSYHHNGCTGSGNGNHCGSPRLGAAPSSPRHSNGGSSNNSSGGSSPQQLHHHHTQPGSGSSGSGSPSGQEKLRMGRVPVTLRFRFVHAAEFVRVGTPIVFRDGSAGAENLGVGVGVVTALCS